jgi:hypothetical protein
VNSQWAIGLDAWIIQDGNYPDLTRLQRAEFAIEFWPSSELAPSTETAPSVHHVKDSEYDVCARIITTTEKCWVLDFGIQVFQDSACPTSLAVGDWVTGRVGLGVDPFTYFERLAKDPRLPALVYPWSIDRITLQTAPFVPGGGGVLVRDETRLGWTEIDQTRAWTDDDGHGSYLLQCTLQPGLPSRLSATST